MTIEQKNMNINDIRNCLLSHPDLFSNKNNISIDKISSGKKYYFIANCGHEFLSLPCNVFYNNELKCPVCSGHQVLIGFNDIWTTHPEIARKLKNLNDGYIYTIGSNKKLGWVCPDCKNEFYKSPIKVLQSLSFCNKCGRVRSYGEKYIIELLNQLYEYFEIEMIFEWSDKKRYDFYIPRVNTIIEIHGKQHYSSSDFSYLGGRDYQEEIFNDNYKMNLAKQNGIENYIIIENKYSNSNDIKRNILQSNLPIILNFDKSDIDWNDCNRFAQSSTTKMICDYYNNVDKNIINISNKFKYCYNTTIRHLKYGASIDICSYNPNESKKNAHRKNGRDW